MWWGATNGRTSCSPPSSARSRTGRSRSWKGRTATCWTYGTSLHAVGRLLEERVAGEVVNVTSGVPQPVERIVEAIEERLGVRARRIRRPGELSVTLASTRRLRRLVPDFRAGVSDADYLGTILDAYLPYYTGLSADVTALPELRESLDIRR